MARIGMIELDQLPEMKVLEDIDSETIKTARMTKFVEIWKENDPPAGAVYDVQNLEFDPIVITQEANSYFEVLLRDRVNQAAKSVTLAFGSGSDLDGIASRYPGGVPRQAVVDTPRGTVDDYPDDYEDDDRYRTRVWLTPNTLGPHGVYESYVVWAMNAMPTLRDATAYAVKRGTPDITVTIMAEGDEVTVGSDGASVTAFPDPTPSSADIETVRAYVLAMARKGLTDVVQVRAPKLVHIDYKIRYWLFPGWDRETAETQLWIAMAALIEKQRWLGYSHVQAAVEAALKTSGVFNVIVDEPADTEIDIHECVVVDSVTMTYAGRGGFEEPTEP